MQFFNNRNNFAHWHNIRGCIYKFYIMSTSKKTTPKKTGKNSDPVNKFKTTKSAGKTTPVTVAVPSARERVKDQDFKRRGDAESNEL